MPEEREDRAVGEVINDAIADRVQSERERIIREVEESGKVTEGDVNALRDVSGVTRMHGHNSTIAEWEASEAGQKFLEEEAPRREKLAKEENKRAEESQGILSDAQERIRDLVSGVREESEKDKKAAEKEAEKSSQKKK